MNGRILIVDDESEIRDMLSRHFRMLGNEVETAGNGKEALVVLRSRRMDVVISDIMMPEMDGVSLLREIRSHYPMIRVVMITGYVTLENALACMRNQADTVVFKPFDDLTELERAVDTAMKYLKHWKQKLRELRGLDPAQVST